MSLEALENETEKGKTASRKFRNRCYLLSYFTTGTSLPMPGGRKNLLEDKASFAGSSDLNISNLKDLHGGSQIQKSTLLPPENPSGILAFVLRDLGAQAVNF